MQVVEILGKWYTSVIFGPQNQLFGFELFLMGKICAVLSFYYTQTNLVQIEYDNWGYYIYIHNTQQFTQHCKTYAYF